MSFANQFLIEKARISVININGLVQERRNSIAKALELLFLAFSCTNHRYDHNPTE